MPKKMLINATHPEEHRVAIIEDGLLTELDIEIAGKEQTKSNIYKAVVTRVETGLQAAFVDYGAERLGFLQIGEIHPVFFHEAEKRLETGKRPRINDLLRRGQEILVQIVKEERGTKGAALTTYLSLPGRFMVLMPDSDTKGISRKIEQESQRKKLKQTMDSLNMPENMGYIVRTAGVDQKKADLKRDVDYLLRLHDQIQTLSKQVKAPTLIYKESNLVIRSIRDYFSDEIDEVLVDAPKVAEEARVFFQEVMPEYARLVKLHQERRPIFARYQIEEQIETINKNKVMLPSGGSIVIDTTEALVAIDVNSGKMASEQGVEATAYKTNLEAATEIARQLRLRDLGGLVVIDFIDMRDRKHIREVEKRLKQAMKADKARVTIGRLSQFGLLEMSRQRIKSALAAATFQPCPHCEGTGRIKTVEAQALGFLRRIHAGLAKGNIGRVELQVGLDVASYLLNTKREELLRIEQNNEVIIHIKACPEFLAEQGEVEFLKREKNERNGATYIQASQVIADISEDQRSEAAGETPTRENGKPAGKEEKPRKKRRSRRRKKPVATAQGDQTLTTETTSDSEKQEQLPEKTVEGEAAVEQSAEPADQPSSKPSARPRRRRKPAAAKSETAEQPKAEQPKAEQPKAEQPKAEQPKAEQPKAEQPKAEQPKAEQPKAEQPKAEQPKAEQPKAEQPKTEQPKAEQPKAEQPKAEQPKAEQPKAEQPKAEQPKAEQPKAEQPKAEQPKAEQPKAEQPKAEEPKEERSKPRRTRRKSPAKKAEQAESDQQPAETKPAAKRPRPRRTAQSAATTKETPAVTVSGEQTAATTAEAPPMDEPPTAAPAPKKRRAPRRPSTRAAKTAKAPSEGGEASPSVADGTETTKQAKSAPARKPRTRKPQPVAENTTDTTEEKTSQS
jgi:ribonuclease E